ncbi:hypothetical protein GCM10023223_20480 [Stackebrandtia albiflava]
MSWFPDSGETARVTFPEPWTDVSHETLHGLGGGRFATTAWARTGTVAVWRLPGRPPERPLTVHKAWQ